jgi:phosphatidate cytidylyltransferase
VCAALILAAGWGAPDTLFRLWLGVLLVAALVAALAGATGQLGRRLLAVAGCLVYLPLCLGAYVFVRRADAGGFHAVFLYLVIAANDAFAQVTGQAFGRRPLAPRLSPSKTVEGTAGGFMFATLLGAALGPAVGWGWVGGAAAGALVAAAGALGDLAESAWKRAMGIKDFSALLGAQGGALDRFDGLILAAPIYFLLLSVFLLF